MAIIVEWVDEPYIAQVVMQGRLTVAQIITAWGDVGRLYSQYQQDPFCILTVILPDRELPLGVMSTVHHPMSRALSCASYHAVVGVDHYIIGMLVEALERLPDGPTMIRCPHYEDALTYLRQMVRARQAGL